jgi:hypothetical protein
MPAHRKRPSPPARMVELLAIEKRAMLVTKGHVTDEDFDIAWDACWAIMVTERAWPHATELRRSWRTAMVEALRPEARACFLNLPSGFNRYMGALAEAMDTSMFAGDEILNGQLVA